jgi:hypothetical protein
MEDLVFSFQMKLLNVGEDSSKFLRFVFLLDFHLHALGLESGSLRTPSTLFSSRDCFHRRHLDVAFHAQHLLHHPLYNLLLLLSGIAIIAPHLSRRLRLFLVLLTRRQHPR